MSSHTSSSSITSDWEMEKKFILGGPVTSVSFATSNNGNDAAVLLVAKGPYLQEVSMDHDRHRRRQLLVFPKGGTIHGIRTLCCCDDDKKNENELLLVFGGRQVTLVDRHTFQPKKLVVLSSSSETTTTTATTVLLEVSDWIWDARIKQRDESNDIFHLALGLANNACEIWQLTTTTATTESASCTRLVCRYENSVRCITYCMSFHGWNDNDCNNQSLMLASGTVFNEILLWTVVSSSTDDDDEIISQATATNDNVATTTTTRGRQVQSHTKLCGHEGVLLDVQFHDSGNMLASCSDDRSVRLWKRQEDSNNWINLWIAYGHSARIWNVCFANDNDNCVVSTGEDGTARLWKNGTEVSHVFRNHSSQSIWRVATTVNNNNNTDDCVVAALATNDGSVKFWNLPTTISNDEASTTTTTTVVDVPDDRPPPTTLQLLIPDDDYSKAVSEEEPVLPDNNVSDDKTKKKKKKKAKKTVQRQAVFGMDFCNKGLVVATRQGSLFRLSSSSSCSWEKLEDWCAGVDNNNAAAVSTTEANCLKVFSNHNEQQIIAVGTTRGAIVLKQIMGDDDKMAAGAVLTDATEYKAVQGLEWWQPDGGLVSFHIRGIIVMWTITTSSLCDSFLLRVLDTTTDAIPTCLLSFGNEMFVVAGDSRGNIVLFNNLMDDDDDTCNNSDGVVIAATDICLRAHAKEHVTCLAATAGARRFLSSGNDGCVCEFAINDGSSKLVRGISVPVTGLSSVSHIFYKDDTRVYVSGYYGNTFKVLDFDNGYELLSFATGGRQRQLVYNNPMSSTGDCRVAVCSSKKDGTNELLLHATQKNEHPIILPPLGLAMHGEPVYDACLFQTRDDATYAALLSGSEDCSVRLTMLGSADKQHSIQLPPQESCIRAVAASRREHCTRTLLVVGGGKLMIDFHLVHDYDDLNNSNDLQQQPGDNLFVRQIGKGRIGKKKGREDIDHRINALAAVPEENGVHFVVAGDSNGRVHCFTVNEEEQERFHVPGILLMANPRPILALDIVRIMSQQQHTVVFVGTTSGEVSVWLVSDTAADPAVSLYSYQAHQMGTNSISTSIIDENIDSTRLLVASVGDDQALVFAECFISKNVKDGTVSFEMLSITKTAEACISALKGIHFISKTEVVCVGYGQQLAVWRWSKGSATERIVSVAVDVSDINTLAFCTLGGRRLVAVGGEGMEVFEAHQIL